MQDGRAVLVGIGLDLIVIHRAVRSAKIYRAFGHLLDARAGAYRLIVDLDVSEFLVVLVEPLGVDRIGETGARAIYEQGPLGPNRACHNQPCEQQTSESLHLLDLSVHPAFLSSDSVSRLCYSIVTIGG